MNFELPEALRQGREQVHAVAERILRPVTRKYDLAEHTVPVEMEEVSRLIAQGLGHSATTTVPGAGAGKEKDTPHAGSAASVRNGANLASVVFGEEVCWGDVGFLVSMPGPGMGLGNSAIGAVGTPEQKKRFGRLNVAMAITEPGAGSDTASIRTTARLDGDHYVLDGEKIFVSGGWRADAVVVWATLDRSLGRAAIKSFVVERGNPGMRYVRQEKKLGIRSSDTAALSFEECRVPRDNLLGSAEIDVKKSFAGVMATFDNTRPGVAAQALGLARACLELTRELLAREGVKAAYDRPIHSSSAVEAELYRMETELEAARLLVWKAAWMADNRQPNSMHASMCKAKAGRMGNAVALRCVELCSAVGYSETELLEKWARDSKIIDVYEGTQQINLLIVARRMLGLSSKELK